MKKIQQSNIILLMVGAAFVIKSFLDKNAILSLIGIFIAFLGISRMLLFKKLLQEEDDSEIGDDMLMKYLKEDPILYVDMIVLYKRGHYKILYEENDGILMHDEIADSYLASAKTLAGAKDIVNMLPQDYGTFVAHEEIFTQIESEWNINSSLMSYNHVYESKEVYDISNDSIKFHLLDDKDMDIVKEHYTIKPLCTNTYLQRCIKRGMLGAYIGNTLVGFIGMHDNGAMGLLEIFDEYQGKGIATLLQMAYTNKLINEEYKGNIYSQVNAKNEISLHLQEKLHFIKAKTPCYWYFS